MIFKSLAAAASGFVLMSGAAMADWEPDGPITMQIAFGAGGSLDSVSRVLATAMEDVTGWQIVAENTPGGGGIAMLSKLARMPADGQNIAVAVNMPVIINLASRPDQTPFELDSFDYLGSIARAEKGLYAAADAPFDTLGEAIEYSQENQLVIAAIPGPEAYVTSALIDAESGDIRRLAAESGGEGTTFILGGQADLAFSGGAHQQLLEAGRIKMIASINNERLSYAPDTPTLVEEGYDLYIDPFFYVAAPAELDEETRQALADGLAEAVQTDAVQEVVRNVLTSDVENFGPEGTLDRMQTGLDDMGPMFTQ
ncbi:tripartite tricarboxylate transporter substrate-binding protein [Roseicyclus sp. F158]|uniref:Tripartite tricarboxylate transporter substrate-binding protein n=1 Tax=Tropicimonas omnivorans TaxID=3075590 RepID=A0ABU3DE87_9RHOB|nr:tripartite tricarboxylate transporter substrate-binding protein [Roseicyclus sp. F158]MDT0682030.1 tripartite tricarboxylate transporter substrate-binding protein [Roseicyclus sp. F158]